MKYAFYLEAKKIYILMTFLCLVTNTSGLRASVQIDSLDAQLISAIEGGSKESVMFLLQKGADANAADSDGTTVLMYAVGLVEELDIILLLLQHGANPDAINNNGWTALMSAAKSKSKEVVALLLQAGANPNTKNNSNGTALMYAAGSVGSQDIVLLLLQAGVEPNAIDNRGWTALMFASHSGSKETVALLLQAGANVDAANFFGRTALMYAASSVGPQDIALLLLQAGANPDAIDNQGWRPLMIAAHSGSKNVVSLLLLQNDVHVNAVNNNGWTALMSAVISRSKEIVALLLQAGADVNSINSYSTTALILAAGEGDQAIIVLLLQARANINILDNQGNTAIDYIPEDNHEMKELLTLYRAFKFVTINQEFGNEPKPEDYIPDKKIISEATGNGAFGFLEEYDEEYGKQIDAFTQDHAAYWHNKVQKVYDQFLFQNNAVPLRSLLTQEIYARSGLLPEIMSFFNSRADFLYVLNRLKIGATELELKRLQDIINAEKRVEKRIEKDSAARKIQYAFKRWNQHQKSK